MRHMWLLLAGWSFLGSACAMAASVEEETDKSWSGAVELGAVFTSGNTEEENIKLRADAVRESELWQHTIHIDGFRSSRDDELTAHRMYSSYQVDRKLNGDSLFGRFSYEDDRFSGFDYQANLTGGYSKALITRETLKLNGDAGIGVRHSRLDTGDRDNELILRLAGDLRWQISENAVFEQTLSTEIGQESTITRSETSLASDIIGSLAMKLAFYVRHQSDVPDGKEETDTEASVTLVYKF